MNEAAVEQQLKSASKTGRIAKAVLKWAILKRCGPTRPP
jgi:hypothetical protein